MVTHYFIVRCRTAAGPTYVRHLQEDLGLRPGTPVWTLRVTLGHHWVQARKYSIEVSCTEKGRFDFRAYDTESPETTLELTSKALTAGE